MTTEFFNVNFVYGEIPSEEDVYKILSTLTVVDKSGARISSDLGTSGRFRLPSGDYRVILKINGLSEVTEFTADQDKTVVLNIPLIFSTIPFEFRQFQSTKKDDVIVFSKSIDLDTQQGICVFIRNIDGPIHSLSLNSEIEVLDSNYNVIQKTQIDNLSPTFLLIPGASGLYFVTCNAKTMPIWVVDSRMTFIFFLAVNGEPIDGSTRVVIAKREHFLGNVDNVLIEILLSKLQNHSWILPATILQKAVEGDFKNSPFLVLIIAHLYARSSLHNKDLDESNLILNVLLSYSKIDIPDYFILEAWVKNRSSQHFELSEYDMTKPPLLRTSLDLLLAMTYSFPDMVPKYSYTDCVFENLLFSAPNVVFHSISAAMLSSVHRGHSHPVGTLGRMPPGIKKRYMNLKLKDVAGIFPFSLMYQEMRLSYEKNWVVDSFCRYYDSHHRDHKLLDILQRMEVPINTLLRTLEWECQRHDVTREQTIVQGEIKAMGMAKARDTYYEELINESTAVFG